MKPEIVFMICAIVLVLVARRAGSSPACLCACACPWAAGSAVAAVPVVVAAAGGSRETVTPRCFVNCFSQLVCSGLGLERHRMEV